jgi:osmoprotectant transport system ATP-binding protein
MIRLEGVGKRYDDGTVAVAELDLDIARGELVALVGPSGCGKSTTLRMVNRLIEPTSGRIHLDGEDVTRVDPVRLRRRIGYVIQRVGLFPHLTVGANVATVPDLLGWPKSRTRPRVAELLELVGLDPAAYADRYPHELSGGQQQRVACARALASRPDIVFADEPTGNLDSRSGAAVLAFLRMSVRELGQTVVMVTHDPAAASYSDRVVFLADGRIVDEMASPTAERVLERMKALDGVRATVEP